LQEPLEPDIIEEDTEETILAMIPLMSGSSRKARYLSWRATGFSVREAGKLADVPQRTIVHWRANDPEFAKFESTGLRELQRNLSTEVMRMEFLRNMRLALSRDSQILMKAATEFEELSPTEYDYLKRIRPLYNPSELLALERAMIPEIEGGRAVAKASVTIVLNGETLESEQAKRAAVRQLLEKFQVNGQTVELIETGNGNSGTD